MMDKFQKRPEDIQPDPQLVATVTAAVMQTLQATGNLPLNEKKNHTDQPDVKTIDLIGLFFAVLEKFWVVMICALLGAGVMGILSSGSVTTYTATSKLFIVDTSSGRIDFTNLQLGSVLTLDYQEVFKTWEVHEMVLEELNLSHTYEQMQSILTITNPEDTRILYITVSYPDAKLAADIANAYAKSAKEFIINTMRGEEPSNFSIALEPSYGHSVSVSSRILIGFVLGSVLAIGVLTLLFVLDDRPRSPEEIQEYGSIPTLSVFPAHASQKKTGPRQKQENSNWARNVSVPTIRVSRFPENDFVSHEAMNTLCTNLSYCGSDVHKILITSRYAGEGKSFVSMNLMRTLSKLGRRVVLVDTDLRASGIQADYRLIYSTKKHYGLSEYLSGLCPLKDVLYQTDIPGACMIPAGHTAPNPLQLLDTENMKQLVERLASQFDVVLLDTPPVGVLVDAVALAKFCDGALLVVGYQKGKRQEIGDAVKSIRQTGCQMLGAVLNGVKFKSLSNKHYYYSSERYSNHYAKKRRWWRRIL